MDLVELECLADRHGQGLINAVANPDVDDVVPRREGEPLRMTHKRNIFPMRIGVPDQEVEDHPVEQLHSVDAGVFH